MNTVITEAILSGTSSAFMECAFKAVVGFFKKKGSINNAETSQIEIRRYVDEYLKRQYPNLVDYRYINDKLYEFILCYIRYMQPQININGNVVINLIIPDNRIEDSVCSFLKLPENKQWNEIKMLTQDESNTTLSLESSEALVDSLKSRAQKIRLKLDISDDCNPEKITELFSIVEKYENIYKKGCER